MTPETQLALAILDAIARGRVLIVGFDRELADSVAGATVFQQDLRAHRATPGSLFGAWFTTDDPFDTAVVELPKAGERLDMLLAMARAVLCSGGRVVLIGHNDAGIRSAGKHLRALIGEPDVIDYRFHCRALVATVSAAQPSSLADWRVTWEDDVAGIRLSLVGYPGVFAHGRVDPATRLLLGALGKPKGRALDAGCGNGAIGAWLARAGCDQVDLADVDAVAVAAASETIAANGAMSARAFASDVYSDAGAPYRLIVSNAPFHAGVRTTSEVAQRIIREAPAHLTRAGALWLVANRFLDYGPAFAEAFVSVSVVAEDAKYRVWRGSEPRG